MVVAMSSARDEGGMWKWPNGPPGVRRDDTSGRRRSAVGESVAW